ncbi:Calmodulin [Armadillidium nasatum]|uniref:Calmodulin n=1 Tax=Armadillidium nasatum TaxID=96803 RepID=A0A5N5SN62_9CRUS|nr:Calmodulin [Armadillidium nasatum]
MPRELSQEELSEAEECFSIFSQEGKLYLKDLGLALRSLGYNPSNSEVQDIVLKFGATTHIDFNRFKELLREDLPAPNTEEELREAFGIFDRDGEGTISSHELKHILMSSGERLTEEEVNMMIREAEVDPDGHVHYEQFVQAMVRK